MNATSEAHGVSWSRPRRVLVTLVALVSLVAATPAVATAAPVSSTSAGVSWARPAAVIARHVDGTAAARAAVVGAGGRVDRELEIIGGVAATLDAAQYTRLARDPELQLSEDAGLELHSTAPATSVGVSLDTVRAHVRATDGFIDGLDGRGVDIALIDSGITPVVGMQHRTQVVNGPDLSFESSSDSLRHLDTYGHGTHLAGIINATPDATGAAGIAPGARIVSLKVADATGATDVSQVIAAIDWVVRHRNADGLNIRVLALAFGTDGVQDAAVDPLAHAAEAAWHAGIVVVVAAGNSGETRVGLNNPATDPFVLAVGAADTGTSVDTDDDHVPAWSSRGDRTRLPDVVAPGVSVVSLRVPGSFIDANHGKAARHGTHGFKGSGTSQATAVTAAMAALIIQADPSVRPDQVKYGLMSGARDISSAPVTADGAGLIDLPGGKHRSIRTPEGKVTQRFAHSSGSGSLEGARGTHHVAFENADGTRRTLQGEVTAFGTKWTGPTKDTAWSGGGWSGASWSGASWSGGAWHGASWSGASWSGASWSGASWSGASWSGASWSGASWSGASWSGASWSGASWSSTLWR